MKHSSHLLAFGICFFVAAVFSASIGCVQTPGARTSIWPTKPVDDPTKIGGTSTVESMGSKLSKTATGVKGQFATMGTTMTSAFGKTKTAVKGAFTTTPTDASGTGTTVDATTLTNKSPSIGPEMFLIQGQMHEAQGQFAKATDFYSKALEAEPKNLPALTAMARLQDRQSDTAKSIEFYKKAIEVAPNQAELNAELGNVYSRTAQLSQAKSQYTKAIALDPKNKSYRSSLAGVLIDEGQAELAEQEIRQVETPAMAQYQMAYLQMTRQNVPVARQHLNNALAIDPGLKPARDMLNSMGGSQLAEQGSNFLQQANTYYQQGGQVMQQVGQLGTNLQSTFATPASFGTPLPK